MTRYKYVLYLLNIYELVTSSIRSTTAMLRCSSCRPRNAFELSQRGAPVHFCPRGVLSDSLTCPKIAKKPSLRKNSLPLSSFTIEMAAKKSKNAVLGFLNATVLFAYNVVQLIGWSCVAWKLFLVATEKSKDTFEATYSATSLLVISLQQFSCLELLLSVAGILPSPLVNVLMQLTARNSVILVAVQFTSSASVLESPAIFITFIAWSVAEIARYSWLLGKTFPDQ